MKNAPFCTTLGTSFYVSRLKWTSFTKLFKYIKFMHSLGFVGSSVKGAAIWAGCTSWTRPIHSILPFCRRSLIIELIKSTNCLHLLELLKKRGGGKSALYHSPQKMPSNGSMYWYVSAPFHTQFWTSSEAPECSRIFSNWSECLLMPPATNWLGSGKGMSDKSGINHFVFYSKCPRPKPGSALFPLFPLSNWYMMPRDGLNSVGKGTAGG